MYVRPQRLSLPEGVRQHFSETLRRLRRLFQQQQLLGHVPRHAQLQIVIHSTLESILIEQRLIKIEYRIKMNRDHFNLLLLHMRLHDKNSTLQKLNNNRSVALIFYSHLIAFRIF